MYDKLLMNSNRYKNFLELLHKKFSEKEFEKNLLEVQKIDLNHYTKKITIEELKKYIDEYEDKEFRENEFKNLQVLLPGNPEIVFKLCLEAVRYNVNMLIGVEDFCLAQNTFIIKTVNEAIKEWKMKNVIEVRNLLRDEEIINNTKNVDRAICIGNSNLYNRLVNKMNNLIFYPYGILEIYSDSDEYEELKKTIYEYAIQNQFEIDMYDDLEFEDAIEAINRDGYKFCSLLISKDEEKIEKFEKSINSTYVICNKNPFKEMRFCLEIK